MTHFLSAATPLAPVAAVFAGIWLAARVVVKWREASKRIAADVAYLRGLDDIAEDTLARWEAERAEAAMVRRVELSVLRVKGEGS